MPVVNHLCMYNLRSHYASQRSGSQIMAVLGQVMATIVARSAV